jgi:hypothetical protein
LHAHGIFTGGVIGFQKGIREEVDGFTNEEIFEVGFKILGFLFIGQDCDDGTGS